MGGDRDKVVLRLEYGAGGGKVMLRWGVVYYKVGVMWDVGRWWCLGLW